MLRYMKKEEEECCSTQLIDGNGEFNVTGLENFIKRTKLVKCGLSYAVVAIMGPQSSVAAPPDANIPTATRYLAWTNHGKSTLMNHLFHTNFKEMDAFKGRTQTTKGIWIAKCVGIEPCTIAMDLEGTDGRERGEDDTMFEKQSALFALAIADIVLINLWCHDIGREHASNKPLLKIVFQVMMHLFSPRKTTLLFVIRDKTKTPLEHLEPILREDVQKIWDGVSKPQVHKDTLLSEFFNVEVTALSSYEEKEMQFKQQVAQLRERFFHSITPGGLAGDRRGVVPASAFSFSAQQIWKMIRENKDLDLPAHKVMVATVRCEEIANEKFSRLASDEGWLALAEAVQTGSVSGFGKKLSSIINAYLSEYDMDAMYFDEGVRKLKRQQLESKALQFVYPAYQTVLGHLRAKVLNNFKHSLGQLFNKGEGFAASVRICSESAMVEFDQGCADIVVKQANWDASRVREKLRRDIELHTESVRIAKLSEITAKYEKQIIEALVEPLESLFETAGRDTWASIRKLLQHETEIAVSGFSIDLHGFELHQGTFDNMVQNLRNFARSVVERIAREEAGKVLILMKDRFSMVFSHDNDSLPRVWTGKEDIRTITKEARSASLRILSVMAAIRLDERLDTIENVLFSSLLDGVTARSAQERSTGASTDPLASSSWEEVPPKDTLITPVQCKCVWRQFTTETEYVIAQAVSAQEANKRRNSWLPPPWAILAMIVLGFNELMLLLRNPLYIMVFFIIFLLSRALWVQLDIEGEFRNGALAGLLSISSRFFPTILNILKRLFNDGQVNLQPPFFLGSQSSKCQTQIPTPITNSVDDSSSVVSSVSSSSENVIEMTECSSSTLTRRRAATVEEADQS